MTTGAATPLLEVRGLARHYAGVAALDGVDLAAYAGEVHAIVGANGAGKSTLMNLLSGAVAPSAGEILVDGTPATHLTPSRAQALGIATVYQEFSLVPQLSVARNVYLGREPTGRFGLVDEARMEDDARGLFQAYDLPLRPDAVVEDLSVAQQQLVELARALSTSSRVLILDEPTAVLSLSEQENLFRIIGRLKAKGLLVLYVSHRLEEILRIADRVSVLRDGRKVGTREVAGLSIDDIVEMMIGGAGARHAGRSHAAGGGAPVAIRYARGGYSAGFDIRPGEILGLAGLVGAGRTTLARAIAGLARGGTTVEVTLDGTPHRFASPQQAMAAGIAYVTEDRKRDGLFANLDIVANASAAALSAFSAAGLRRPAAERKAVSSLLSRLRLAARTLDMPVDQLSGGNQQKVVFARALMRRPRLLICDEPTRGVDVGAKAEIYDLLTELAGQGMAVLVVSSEIEELLALCHRIAVMRDRRLVAEFSAGEATEADILRAASGAAIEERDAAQ